MNDTHICQAVSKPVDFLIITALREERDALLGLLEGVNKVQVNGCPTYYLSTVPAYNRGGDYSIAVTMLSQLGNVEAAQHTTQAIRDLNPDYVLMVGIAGGIKGRARLGDVIVATQVLYYEQAKQHPEGSERRHQIYPVDHVLLDRAQNYNDATWRNLVSIDRPDGKDTEVLNVAFGPVAAGEKIIADSAFVSELVGSSPKLVAIEMESYGVAVAAANSGDRPRFLAIRGVCDFADSDKDDVWHEYAAQSAAAFTIGFLRSGPVTPRTARVADVTKEADRPTVLITIRHQSMEPIPAKAILESLPLEFGNRDTKELVVDQTDLYVGGRLTDPLGAAQRQVHLTQQTNDLQSAYPGAEIAYYGIAHIPLLFLAGYQLSNKTHIHLFEHNRQTARWNQLQGTGSSPSLELEGPLPPPSSAQGDVVVRVSVSYLVAMDALEGLVPSPIASLHLRVTQPMVDLVTSEHQIGEYSSIFRRLLDEIHERFLGTRKVHLFYSGPATLAFSFGRQISKTIHPRIIVYNYVARDTPKYLWGLEITGEIGSGDSLVNCNP